MTTPAPHDALAALVDLERHPIGDLEFIATCQQTLAADGALVLSRFFTSTLIDAVLADTDGREDDAFYAAASHNIWLTPPDLARGPDHIFNRQITSTKGLLADDQISATSPLRVVYGDAGLRRFVASVVGVDVLHPYADPLSSINVHFHRDGEELGWHFDNSSFAVTALIRAPQAGGVFEYAPGLRTSETGREDFGAVAAAVDRRVGVRTLDFGEGDLVLFRGRNSMHRVTPSVGSATRVLVVFAWNDEPGISLSDAAKQTFYGRLT